MRRSSQYRISLLLVVVFMFNLFTPLSLLITSVRAENESWTETEAVSLSSLGEQNYGQVMNSEITPDGRYVVFESTATNLDNRVSNMDNHIYVHDRLTGQTELIDVGAEGTPANSYSERPSISDDGEWIVFQSMATNLVKETLGIDPDSFENVKRIFVANRNTKEIALVSVSTLGELADHYSEYAQISGDGKKVVFQSNATNLLDQEELSSNNKRVYLHDLNERTTQWVADSLTEIDAQEPSISYDGRVIVFKGSEYRFTDDDAYYANYIYRYENGAATIINNRIDNDLSNGDSFHPVVSADGSKVVFSSTSSNLVTNDMNTVEDVFLYEGGEITRLSVSESENEGNGKSDTPDISPDGRFVAFRSEATNLREGINIESYQNVTLYIYDLEANTLSNLGGLESAHFGLDPSLSNHSFSYSNFTSANVAMNSSDMPNWSNDSQLALLPQTDESLQLTWIGIQDQDVLGYKVYQTAIDPNLGSAYTKKTFLGYTEETTFVVEDPPMGQQNVSYSVEAVNQYYHTSQNGPKVTLDSIDDKIAPTWVENSIIRVSSVNSNSIALSWPEAHDNVGISSYKIYGDDPNRPGPDYGVIAETPFSYITIESLEPDTLYSYSVTAIDNSNNESEKLPAIDVRTLSSSNPTVNGQLTAQINSKSIVELSWSAGNAITRNEVWDVTNPNSPEKVADVSGTNTSYSLNGLASSTTYQLKVIGFNGLNQVYETNLVQVNTPELSINSVQLSHNGIFGGIATLGSNETVTVVGPAGQTAVVTATFTTWYDVDQTTLLNTPRVATKTIVMTESAESPGTYTGSFTFSEGIERLMKVEASLIDSKGQQTPIINATGLPVYNSAKLTITTTSNGSLASYRLNAYSPSTMVSQGKTIIGDNNTVIFERLQTASDYTVRALNPSGKFLREMTGIELKSGLSTDLEMNIPISKKLLIEVVSGDGPEKDIMIDLYDQNGNYLESVKTDVSGNASSGELKADWSQVKAKLKQLPVEYINPGEIVIPLNDSTNRYQISLNKLDKAVVKGKITNKNGNPVEQAIVQVSQQVNGQSVQVQAFSDVNGDYILPNIFSDVQSEITFSAPNLRGSIASSEAFTVSANETKVINKQLETKSIHALTINLYTKYAGGEWQGPLPIDWTTGIHLGIHVDGELVSSRTIILEKKPGETVVVKANGAEGGLSADSKVVTLEEDGSTEVELRLQESYSTIFAQLMSEPQWKDYPIRWNATLLKQDAPNWWRSVDYFAGSNSNMALLTRETGQMKLKIQTDWQGSSEMDINLAPNSSLNLGTQFLKSSPRVFVGETENYFTAYPTDLIPGKIITVRMGYFNPATEVKNAKLLLPIPEGMELLEDSVWLNGAAVDSTPQQNQILVPVGNLAAGSKGTVTYQLKTTMDMPKSVTANAQIQFEQEGQSTQETLGLIQFNYDPISIEAPATTNQLKWKLSGKGIAGQAIQVFESGQPIGQVTTGPGGLWTMEVEMPDPKGSKVYSVYAETNFKGSKYRSSSKTIKYDPNKSSIQKLVIQQSDGRRVSLDVSQGPVKFPFVVVPGRNFYFEVYFNQPDQVGNVKVHLKGGNQIHSVPAELKQGVFYAEIPSYYNMEESVYVTFDQKKQPSPQIETLDQFKQELPPAMRDYKVVDSSTNQFEQVDPNTLKGSMEFTLPQVRDMKFQVELQVERNVQFTPTAEDIKLAEALGVDAYGVKADVTQEGEHFATIIEAYVPENMLGNPEQVFAQLSSAINPKTNHVRMAGWGDVGQKLVKVAAKVLWDEKDIAGQLGKGGGQIYDTKNAVDGRGQVGDKMEQLGDLADKIGRCNPGTAGYYGQRIEKLATHALSIEAAKWGMMVAGAVLAPATFGGSLALMGLSMGIGAVMDAQVDHEMNKLKDAVNNSSQQNCDPPDSGGSVSEIHLGNPTVQPVWIYDPSGYVYETFPENRVKDVKATVFYQDETGQFVPWNAEWFGQINPQLTDTSGRYGWDVPKGRWQVVYEKEGYETTKSDELDVPPPHFDVNIPMKSYKAPEVTGVKAATSNTYGTVIDVAVDKYIAADRLSPDGMEVWINGQKQSGELEILNPRTDENGIKWTQSFRYKLAQPATAGELLDVTIRNAIIVSYAGVAMERDWMQNDLPVSEKDEAAPQAEEASTNLAGNIVTLSFDEPLDKTRMLSRGAFTISGTPLTVLRAEYGLEEPAKSIKLTLSGNLLASESVEVEVESNQISDLGGNLSSKITVPVGNKSISSNAKLQDLKVDGYRLSPAFNANTAVYTITIPTGVESVTVTASPSHAKSSIRVNGTTVGNGVKSEVVIENEALLLAVQAEDGQTNRIYELKVVRGQETSSDRDSDKGQGSSPSGTISNVSTNGNLNIPKGQSGTVSLGQDIQIQVPANALNQAFRLAIKQIDPFDSDTKDMMLISPLYEVTKDVVGNFQQPVTLTFKIDANRYKGRSISVYYFDETARKWVNIGGNVNGETITVQVNHFTKFAVFASDPKDSVTSFTDLGGHWAASSIMEAASLGIASGYPDLTFRPNETVTRAQFVTMLVRAVKLGTESDESESLNFSDSHLIPDWAKSSITEAVRAGIISGYEDQSFRPNQRITRTELTVMISKALKLNQDQTPVGITTFIDDALIPAWAKRYVLAAVSAKLIQGSKVKDSKFDGQEKYRFAPNDNATRAEAITMLLRFSTSDRHQ